MYSLFSFFFFLRLRRPPRSTLFPYMTLFRSIVVMAASACETARLLLNSKSVRFPHGLGNSSGVVGKYLTDTTGTGVTGFIPKMMDGVPHNEDGTGGAHLYMPWWLDNKKLDFPRG